MWGHPRWTGHDERSDRMWSTGEGNGKPLQYSCLENPMNSMKRQNEDREAWCALIPGVEKSRTRLSNWTELNWTDWFFSRDFFFLSYWEIFYLLIFCMPFLYLYLWSCNFLFSFSPPPPPSFSSLSPFFSSLWCIFQFLTSAWMPSENEFRSIFTNPIFWKNLWQSDIISSLNFFNRI